jgi:hypothetical protein
MIIVVLEAMTWFELTHEPDELGADRRVRLVIFDDLGDRDGRRLTFPLLRQSIAR